MMQKLCAYLIFVFSCHAFNSLNATTIVQQSHHQHHNRHLHLQSHLRSHHPKLQLQLLQHNNTDSPAKNHINFYYSSQSRTHSSERNSNISPPSHRSINEANFLEILPKIPSNKPNDFKNGKFNRNETQSQRYNEPVPTFNINLKHKLQPLHQHQQKPSIITTKSSLNPLKLTLIQANGNYPNFYRWPIAPQPPNTEQSHPTIINDYGIKWRPANEQFIPNFKPTIENNPMATTTTPATTNEFHIRDHRIHSKHHTGHGYVIFIFISKNYQFSHNFLFFCFISNSTCAIQNLPTIE